MVNRWLLLKGGCYRQVSIVVPLVVWWTGGCYCKVVAVGMYICRYSCVSGRMVDMWLLL